MFTPNSTPKLLSDAFHYNPTSLKFLYNFLLTI